MYQWFAVVKQGDCCHNRTCLLFSIQVKIIVKIVFQKIESECPHKGKVSHETQTIHPMKESLNAAILTLFTWCNMLGGRESKISKDTVTHDTVVKISPMTALCYFPVIVGRAELKFSASPSPVFSYRAGLRNGNLHVWHPRRPHREFEPC